MSNWALNSRGLQLSMGLIPWVDTWCNWALSAKWIIGRNLVRQVQWSFCNKVLKIVEREHSHPLANALAVKVIEKTVYKKFNVNSKCDTLKLCEEISSFHDICARFAPQATLDECVSIWTGQSRVEKKLCGRNGGVSVCDVHVWIVGQRKLCSTIVMSVCVDPRWNRTNGDRLQP